MLKLTGNSSGQELGGKRNNKVESNPQQLAWITVKVAQDNLVERWFVHLEDDMKSWPTDGTKIQLHLSTASAAGTSKEGVRGAEGEHIAHAEAARAAQEPGDGDGAAAGNGAEPQEEDAGAAREGCAGGRPDLAVLGIGDVELTLLRARAGDVVWCSNKHRRAGRLSTENGETRLEDPVTMALDHSMKRGLFILDRDDAELRLLFVKRDALSEATPGPNPTLRKACRTVLRGLARTCVDLAVLGDARVALVHRHGLLQVWNSLTQCMDITVETGLIGLTTGSCCSTQPAGGRDTSCVILSATKPNQLGMSACAWTFQDQFLGRDGTPLNLGAEKVAFDGPFELQLQHQPRQVVLISSGQDPNRLCALSLSTESSRLQNQGSMSWNADLGIIMPSQNQTTLPVRRGSVALAASARARRESLASKTLVGSPADTLDGSVPYVVVSLSWAPELRTKSPATRARIIKQGRAPVETNQVAENGRVVVNGDARFNFQGRLLEPAASTQELVTQAQVLTMPNAYVVVSSGTPNSGKSRKLASLVQAVLHKMLERVVVVEMAMVELRTAGIRFERKFHVDSAEEFLAIANSADQADEVLVRSWSVRVKTFECGFVDLCSADANEVMLNVIDTCIERDLAASMPLELSDDPLLRFIQSLFQDPRQLVLLTSLNQDDGEEESVATLSRATIAGTIRKPACPSVPKGDHAPWGSRSSLHQGARPASLVPVRRQHRPSTACPARLRKAQHGKLALARRHRALCGGELAWVEEVILSAEKTLRPRAKAALLQVFAKHDESKHGFLHGAQILHLTRTTLRRGRFLEDLADGDAVIARLTNQSRLYRLTFVGFLAFVEQVAGQNPKLVFDMVRACPNLHMNLLTTEGTPVKRPGHFPLQDLERDPEELRQLGATPLDAHHVFWQHVVRLRP
ncbi:unnamed protein product [Durusdinium trenchii]|uniref:Uncharacterized protein n=1 Tax=Durusdinium trenchii TaxID=1381693 RepID=A0ABP0PXS8_9DINO